MNHPETKTPDTEENRQPVQKTTSLLECKTCLYKDVCDSTWREGETLPEVPACMKLRESLDKCETVRYLRKIAQYMNEKVKQNYSNFIIFSAILTVINITFFLLTILTLK